MMEGPTKSKFLFSLFSLIRKLQGLGESLFVIQDSKNSIFGGFFTDKRFQKGQFNGNGESFLFKKVVSFSKKRNFNFF